MTWNGLPLGRGGGRGFGDQAPGRPVGGLVGVVGVEFAVVGQEAVGPVDVAPARLGELGRLSDHPAQRRDLVVAAPGLVGLDQPPVLIRQVRRDRIQQRPDDDAGDPGPVVGVVERPGQPARPGLIGVDPAIGGGPELGFPQRLAQAIRYDLGSGRDHTPEAGGGQPAGVVDAQDADRLGEGGVFGQVVGDGPPGKQREVAQRPAEPFRKLRGLVGRDDLGAGEPGRVQRLAQVHVPVPLIRGAPVVLVPAADVADRQAAFLGAPQPVDEVTHVGGAPDPPGRVAGPGRGRPLQAVELDLRIAGQGLVGQPELIAGIAGQMALDRLHRRLGAIGGEAAPADLQLQHLQRRPVVRREHVVEDLRAFRLGIVDQQPGVAAAPAERADAVKHRTRAVPVDDHVGLASGLASGSAPGPASARPADPGWATVPRPSRRTRPARLRSRCPRSVRPPAPWRSPTVPQTSWLPPKSRG